MSEIIDLGCELLYDKDRPWEVIERLLTGHFELERQVLDLTQELMILKRMPRFKNQPPKQQEKEQTKADASCQTWNQSSMEIETQVAPLRRLIRCTSLKKKIFYTKVYTKKYIEREKMEVEIENKEHRTKTKKKTTKKRQRVYKIFVKKEVMEIEKKKEMQIEKTPPKREKKKKKAEKRRKGTPKEWAPREKKNKKNSPKKDLEGSELKLNKTLNQPTKVTLITDFFDVIGKRSSIKAAPDPKKEEQKTIYHE